jgi:hypothetical protein
MVLLLRRRSRSVGRIRIDHKIEALLSSREFWNIVLRVSSTNVLLHGAETLLLQ